MKRNILYHPDIPEKFLGFPRTDTHCHTIYSDGCVTIEKLVKLAKKSGFSAVIKADHDTIRGNRKLRSLAKAHHLIPINGVEMSTERGHMVVLNVSDKLFPILYKNRHSFAELLDIIHENNCIAVMAHPWWRNSMRDEVFKYAKLNGFEALNHSSPFGTLSFIKRIYNNANYDRINYNNLTPWAGSDSHGGIVYGRYYNIFLTSDTSQDGILEAMHKGRLLAVGRVLPLALLIADGLINQPVQMRNMMFYKKH